MNNSDNTSFFVLILLLLLPNIPCNFIPQTPKFANAFEKKSFNEVFHPGLLPLPPPQHTHRLFPTFFFLAKRDGCYFFFRVGEGGGGGEGAEIKKSGWGHFCCEKQLRPPLPSPCKKKRQLYGSRLVGWFWLALAQEVLHTWPLGRAGWVRGGPYSSRLPLIKMLLI